MPRPIRIGLVGDYSDEVIAHQAIPVAFDNASTQLGTPIEHEWIPTEAISPNAISTNTRHYDALWFTPGSPYNDHLRVLNLIRQAREENIPTVGTCGGCQHILLEWALNVLQWKDATHAEFQNGGRQVISPLVCRLAGDRQPLTLLPDTRLFSLYGGKSTLIAEYQCGFGINPEFRTDFFDINNLKANSLNEEGEVRSFELTNHDFMIATMFQPEREALKGERVPLAEGLIQAVLKRH